MKMLLSPSCHWRECFLLLEPLLSRVPLAERPWSCVRLRHRETAVGAAPLPLALILSGEGAASHFGAPAWDRCLSYFLLGNITLRILGGPHRWRHHLPISGVPMDTPPSGLMGPPRTGRPGAGDGPGRESRICAELITARQDSAQLPRKQNHDLPAGCPLASALQLATQGPVISAERA